MTDRKYLRLLGEVPDITLPDWQPSDTQEFFKRLDDAICSIKAQMVQDLHYIECGWTRPRLTTTGADLLAAVFGLEPKYSIDNTFPVTDSPSREVHINCTIIHNHSGQELCTEIGVSETREMAEERAYVDAVITATVSRGHFAEELGDELL